MTRDPLLVGLTVLSLLACRRETNEARSVGRQASPETTANLLVNPSFEKLDAGGVPAGWMSGSHPVVSTDPAKAHSGQVAARGAADYFSQAINIQGGKTYWLGHYTRSDRPGQLARLQVNFGNDRGDTLDVKIDVVPATPEWQWHEMKVTAPAKATTATVYLQPHENSDVWFDDVWFGSGSPSRNP